MALADVVTKVVEFQMHVLEELHQLPIANLDQTDRRSAPGVAAGTEVTGKVLVNGLAFQGGLGIQENGCQAFAIEDVVGRRSCAGQIQQGRVNIDVYRCHIGG